ncbi:hypothetical protein EPIR_1638 [Erwinia piriflorinigrans CFBP 5888]|uniref:Uncharacterized protein n=1 Tax=Erwinia piriflorinigrans CFBP 5888 TaxID=1161919 RepID=V5Z6Z2_9GAMM|nr:hypothetical protein EPIR_1638 [Erwinia piriflorinigrans CFBP 5888]
MDLTSGKTLIFFIKAAPDIIINTHRSLYALIQ